MGKELSEMTLAELWALFPIVLTEHKPEWADAYAEMEAKLKEQLSGFQILRISHIGSTAVPGIWAKPIVDILVEIVPGENMAAVAERLVNGGFLKMSQAEHRISLNCGYTKNGFAEKVYHLHLRHAGDHDELYFRDYLRDHPGIAKEYEQLKRRLWQQYEHDRDAYTEAKTAFIQKTRQMQKFYTEIAMNKEHKPCLM